MLDYDEAFFFANSSKTFGARASTSIPISPRLKLNLAGSYARQSDLGSNPFAYSADYIAAEIGTSLASLGVSGGYEMLGADNGRAVQTPMATLHKFNGWADVFLTTPNTGIKDYYAGATYKFDKLTFVKGLNAAVIYHQFDSDFGNLDYGNEWDASVGFALKQFAITAKYANYNARVYSVDTEKFWLQAEINIDILLYML